jgi:serralysin
MNDSQLNNQYETFAKVIYLYFEHQDRDVLQFDAFFKSQGYEIDRVFDAPNSGFQALALRSIEINRSPVLIFQGQIDCDRLDRATSPDRFVFSQFIANKKSIQDWLTAIVSDRQLNPRELKPDITGVDLSVALNQLINSEFITLIGAAILFESIGGDILSVQLFQPESIACSGEIDRSAYHARDLDLTHQPTMGTSSDWYGGYTN